MHVYWVYQEELEYSAILSMSVKNYIQRHWDKHMQLQSEKIQSALNTIQGTLSRVFSDSQSLDFCSWCFTAIRYGYLKRTKALVNIGGFCKSDFYMVQEDFIIQQSNAKFTIVKIQKNEQNIKVLQAQRASLTTELSVA